MIRDIWIYFLPYLHTYLILYFSIYLHKQTFLYVPAKYSMIYLREQRQKKNLSHYTKNRALTLF